MRFCGMKRDRRLLRKSRREIVDRSLLAARTRAITRLRKRQRVRQRGDVDGN